MTANRTDGHGCTIRAGKRHWLWRAVDNHSIVLDILIQQRRDQCAAETFLRRVLAAAGGEPPVVITDKLASYPPPLRRVLTKTEPPANARRQLLAEWRRTWREVVGLPPVA